MVSPGLDESEPEDATAADVCRGEGEHMEGDGERGDGEGESCRLLDF